MKNKISEITLDNVEDFCVPLESHPLNWKFEDEGGYISEEFKDQIIPLDSKAAKFLWDFESTQRHLGNIPKIKDYYKSTLEFYSGSSTNQEVKKWLYNLGVAFDQKVFWVDQPQWGFILTWKMIIKFSDDLFFGSDAVIWDRTLNWCLNYDHNDAFYFGKDRIGNTYSGTI
ncbi:hypothetical protein RQM59_12110 [Flavobacteriaceae bacterium S356]|uniref:Uncharacterized protein n=1 Tax=Asprobacillus argus TaxID=3076534 RepID=A0ABU3LIJ5_9FLAO|nr:hypothetical protein [Flavobacteriaceae bacterium S356]